MLSGNLEGLLETLEKVREIEGVEEFDNSIIETRQNTENKFLGQVLGLANVQEASTVSDNQSLTFQFEDEDYAKLIMDLAKAKGVPAGSISPSKCSKGCSLSIKPEVFTSEQMEDVRHFIGLGVEEHKEYALMVTDLMERANPNHKSADGKFTSVKNVKSNKGSRSFQFSAPLDKRKKRSMAVSDPENTYNKPHFRHQNSFRVRKTPCGRSARPYFRKLKGMSDIPKAGWYKRCWDGKVPDWATEGVTDSIGATKEYLASVLRGNLKKAT